MTEFQLAFQHSQATRPDCFPHSDLFANLLQAGFSVILLSGSQYCRVTDAILPGENRAIIAAFATREAAIEHWMQHHDQFEAGGYDEDYALLHPQNLDRYADDLYLPIIGTICNVFGKPIPNLRLPLPPLPLNTEPSNPDDVPF
ncbi:MAG: hypothetical protein MUC48_05095 [Leptolyngbya sp. Prado105]|jgi:hypothetical protein|nr:hypothetical protein [Leptolyngbya sp. Prado105]